nr:hypothetical protein [Tanacetum cinerariifolium]
VCVVCVIREEFRTSSGPSDAGGNPPSVTIHTWLKRFNKQKPYSLRRRQLPWTRRIRSLTWRRSLMLWVVRMHLRQDWLCISLRVMHLLGEKPISKPRVVMPSWSRRILRLARSSCSVSFDLLGYSGQLLAPRRSRRRTFSGDFADRRVVIGISRPLSRVVTGATVIITTVMDQTGEVVVTTIAAATTTTTLAVTTGIPVIDVTRGTRVISPTDLPILVLSSLGVPLRATFTHFALLVDEDTQKSVVELRADKKPGATCRVFAITEGHAANTS